MQRLPSTDLNITDSPPVIMYHIHHGNWNYLTKSS